VIAKLDVLGPRVEQDVDEERQREAERKAEIRFNALAIELISVHPEVGS
jgi:hypothetical protein